MIELPWTLFGLGFAIGAAGAALHFAGLALGMRLALARAATTTILLVSAACRIGLLLLLGLGVARLGGASLAGFVVAFLVVRLLVLVAVRPSPRRAGGIGEGAPWN